MYTELKRTNADMNIKLKQRGAEASRRIGVASSAHISEVLRSTLQRTSRKLRKPLNGVSMAKRLCFSIFAALSSLSMYAISPHGSRVDYYDRVGGSGGGGIIGFLAVIVVGAILLIRFLFRSKD